MTIETDSKVELLPGNIGYLKIDRFSPADDAGVTLAAAMAFLKNGRAIIFDLRENIGGDPAMVALALSYLVPRDTHLNSFHYRDKPIDEQAWSLPYVTGALEPQQTRLCFN